MAAITAALLACAMHVAAPTLEAVVRCESGGNPLALHVNHLDGPQPVAHSVEQAAQLARHYITAGYSVDLGIMQVNNRNLLELGETIESVLDPCRNITGGASILADFYGRAAQHYGEGQAALLAALSAYNTGDFSRGLRNGYAACVASAGVHSGAIPASTVAAVPNPLTADTLVYSKGDIHVVVN
jgi:type IV secretion system protein VirB1